jgi:hypothetical protein
MARTRYLSRWCVSDLRFDSWYAGELGPAEARAIEAHLNSCADCRQRHGELRAQAEDFLARYPQDVRMANGSRIVPSDGRPRRVWRRAVIAMSGGLAAAAGFVWLALLPAKGGSSWWTLTGRAQPTERRDEAAGVTRVKGGARLGFVVKRGSRILEGHDGLVVHPNDRLRFSITCSEPRHVAILSRDATGLVSEYFPGDGRSRAFGVSRDVLLDSSVELDDTLGMERIIAVFCAEAFDVAPLAAMLAKDDAIRVAANCSLDALEVRKTAR